MACCRCCCGGVDCAEGDQGKCCCGGPTGTCCQAGEYCCSGVCQATPCGGCESLLITYDWSNTGQSDLDTGTTFLGTTVGYDCGASSTTYMTGWTDNTGGSEAETVTILFGAALAANQWSGSTTVSLNAGWYTPAGGSGNVTVRVQCVGDNATEQTLSVSPGSQNGCATTNVATVTINANGTFTLNPLP